MYTLSSRSSMMLKLNPGCVKGIAELRQHSTSLRYHHFTGVGSTSKAPKFSHRSHSDLLDLKASPLSLPRCTT